MNTIAGEWEAFSSKVIHKEADDVQRRDMRRAFYAGAYAMMRMQVTIAGEFSEDATVAMMKSWQAELMDFGYQVSKGLA